MNLKISWLAGDIRKYTPSGNFSIVHDYVVRVEHSMKWEGLNWEKTVASIDMLLILYGPNGPKLIRQ